MTELKGNLPVAGGLLTSKPAWLDTARCSATPAFFARAGARCLRPGGATPMNQSQAQQIAQAAVAFEQQRTGNHLPKSVTVVLCESTMVITLHEALLPAEKILAQKPAGAAQVQEFYRQLFSTASEAMRQEIKRI